MILSDFDIWEFIREKRIDIRPKPKKSAIRPMGVRVHLADELLLPKPDQPIDLEKAEGAPFERKRISPSGFIMRPGQFVLGSTVERIRVSPDLACSLDGRSTIARLGLTIHCTSSVIDNTHDNHRAVTLEMLNVGPFELLLKPRMAIGMVIFSKLISPIAQRSQRQYEGQVGVTAPKSWEIKE
jgi:dCTP deaminase